MSLQPLIAALYGLGLLAWLFWPSLAAAWQGWITRRDEPAVEPTTWVMAEPLDIIDLRALRQIERRYERLNCAEGQAAVQVLYKHFFHNGGPT